MAVKFSDFSVGTLGTDLEMVGYDITTPENVRVSYSDLKNDILGDITPAGSNTQIQYNNSGAFGASAGLTYDDSTGLLTLRKDQNAFTDLLIHNNTNAANGLARLRVRPSQGGGSEEGQVASTSPLATPYGVILGSRFGLYTNMPEGMFIANEFKNINFGTGSGNPSSKMILTSAGRLLLGTTTEGTNILEVNGTARYVSSSNNNYNSIRLQANNLSTILDIGWAGIQTNQIFTLDSGSNNIYIGTSGASRLGISTTAPSVKAEIRGTTTAATTIGTEEEFKITRLTTADGSYPQAVSFALGTYQINGAGNNYGPKTRFDIKLKSTQSENVTTDLTVITFLDNNSVGINNTAPNSSSLLDLTSTTKGFLPPRGTNTQMLAIASPATGLMFYDTTNNKLNCYDGTTWQACW